MNPKLKKWISRSSLLLIIIIGVVIFLQNYNFKKKDLNIVAGNGRIEATEIDISTKIPGRIKQILVREGDFVKAGQTVAYMDTEVLEAQLKEAKANLLKAKINVSVAKSMLLQRQSEKAAAEAVVYQREAELDVAEKKLVRSIKLVKENAISQQEKDDDYARYNSVFSATNASIAQVNAADAAIVTANELVTGAESSVEAAQATVERIEADIKDCALVSPREGRIQYKVAQVGEVLPAGGRVLNMVDLSDVYMTFFLSTGFVGKVPIGADVKIILDTIPNYAIPAKVSFISDVAQFTPKTVETAVEREKLMFRVRAQVPETLLKKYITQVKTGLPGMAYLRLDPSKPWPAFLEMKNEL